MLIAANTYYTYENIRARRIRWKIRMKKKSELFLTQAGECLTTCFFAPPMENASEWKTIAPGRTLFGHQIYSYAYFMLGTGSAYFCNNSAILLFARKKQNQQTKWSKWMKCCGREREREQKKSLTYSCIRPNLRCDPLAVCIMFFFFVLFISILAISHPFHSTAVIYSIYRGSTAGCVFFPPFSIFVFD